MAVLRKLNSFVLCEDCDALVLPLAAASEGEVYAGNLPSSHCCHAKLGGQDSNENSTKWNSSVMSRVNDFYEAIS